MVKYSIIRILWMDPEGGVCVCVWGGGTGSGLPWKITSVYRFP